MEYVIEHRKYVIEYVINHLRERSWRKSRHPPYFDFYHNTPPWMSINNVPRVNLIRKKIYGKKILMKEKEYTYLEIHLLVASLKTLQGKPNGIKPCKGKRVQRVLTHPDEIISSHR